MAKEFDLVVRGGTIADGTGAALHEADIAVKDGKIAAVGKVSGSADEEIDAKGLLVTPGFVDIHTHYDGQATWDSHLQPSSWHGVTTAVMGNCGVGFAPVKVEDRQRLIELMEGVEDIPGAALDEGLNWSWESFGQYLDALEARPRDMDLGAQLPHGALRVFVMGERAAKLEEATAEEVAEMRALTAEAMRAGALGFSTSRTLNHRTVKGDPTPSLRASEAELLGIALGMKDAGRGVIEFISDFNTPNPESEFEMIDRLLTASGRPFSVSLAQGHSKPEGWRRLLGLVEGLAAKGHAAKAQVAPRPIGVLQGLQASRTPFSMCRSYKAIQHKSVAERLAIMRDPAFRAKLLAEAHEPLRSDMAARLTDYDRMFPLGDPPDYEPAQESSLGARARREGRDPREVIYDYLIEGEGKNFIFSPFANFAAYNLDCCSEMMQSPHTLIGLGDGGAHVGLISDGSFPTSLLSHWGRDRASGRLDVSWLVKRQTSDNARAVGLNDRGRVAVGYKADLNVIDFDKLRVEAPVMKWDLPAGGKRLLQKARGYRATIVSGAVTYRDGEATGALPASWCAGRRSPRNQNDARYHEADAEQVNRRQAFVESERRCEGDDGETGAGENRIGDGERDRLDRTRKQEGVGGAEHQSNREHRPPDARRGVGDRPVDEVRRDVEEHRAAELQVGAPHSATGSVSRPRRVKVGRRVGGAASSIVGKASSSALKAMGPSMRASTAPRQ